MKVFLGGTVVQDKTLDDKYGWRKDLIPKLKVDYYNPVVYKRDKMLMKKNSIKRIIFVHMKYIVLQLIVWVILVYVKQWIVHIDTAILIIRYSVY